MCGLNHEKMRAFKKRIRESEIEVDPKQIDPRLAVLILDNHLKRVENLQSTGDYSNEEKRRERDIVLKEIAKCQSSGRKAGPNIKNLTRYEFHDPESNKNYQQYAVRMLERIINNKI